MKILVTNDDGIRAEGLKILVEKAQKYGKVVVVAPRVNQSATSHRINIRDHIEVQKTALFPGVEAYSLDSTPADCVRFATFELGYDFDVVFSGINRGYNLGSDIFYSGTVAGASEAAFTQKRGIAFSTHYLTFEGAERHFDEVMEYIVQHQLFDYAPLFNVNFPKESQGIKITRQGDVHFDTRFEKVESSYRQVGHPNHEKGALVMESDVHAIYNHYISIMPMNADRTDIDAYRELIKTPLFSKKETKK
jgi:5'-nucleotidase